MTGGHAVEIACPSCDETYRIEPTRLRGRGARSTCLACGEALLLRVLHGAAGQEGAGLGRRDAAAAPVDEGVPLWSEPRDTGVAASPAASAPDLGDAALALPAEEPGHVQAAAAPEPEPAEAERPAAWLDRADVEAPAAPAAPAATAETPPAVHGPTLAPPPEAAPAAPAEKPLAPYLATPAPAASASGIGMPPAGVAPEVVMPTPSAEAAAWGPAVSPSAKASGPSAPAGLAPGAEKPLAPYLHETAATPSQPGAPKVQGFSFARVGDVRARAHRLARALVSDILVYNPKKVEQGLRDGNLKELMKEEVEKSWDEFSERLGADAARTHRAAFIQALNDVLARGNPTF